MILIMVRPHNGPYYEIVENFYIFPKESNPLLNVSDKVDNQMEKVENSCRTPFQS